MPAALLTVAALTAIVASGIRRSAAANAVIVLATLAALATFVAAGLPSVEGVRWRAGEVSGEHGGRTPHTVAYADGELELTLYSRFRLGPALHWHLYLLGQLLGAFYVAKVREEKLRQASYLQAVHETGARLTHDIKNLLQSLSVLTSMAAREVRMRSARWRGV